MKRHIKAAELVPENTLVIRTAASSQEIDTSGESLFHDIESIISEVLSEVELADIVVTQINTRVVGDENEDSKLLEGSGESLLETVVKYEVRNLYLTSSTFDQLVGPLSEIGVEYWEADQ